MKFFQSISYTRLKLSFLFTVVMLFSGTISVVFGQSYSDVAKIIDLTNSINKARLQVSCDTNWHKIQVGANLTQGSFSSSWQGGGGSSAGLAVFVNALFEKKTGRLSWRQDFQAQYGFLKNHNQGFRKSQDRLFYDLKHSYQIHKSWIFFANANFQSQFSKGYDYSTVTDSTPQPKQISGFLAPAYITESIGIEFKPVPYFFVDFSPGAFRQTVVMNKDLYMNTPDQSNYGVLWGKRVQYDVALMQLVANFDKNITPKINLKFRYQFFSNIKDPLDVDSRLDASITARVHKFVNVNLNTIVVYNADQSADIQYAQGLNLGVLYQF